MLKIKKYILIIAITLCIFQMIVLATAIDIGSPATDRSTSYSEGNTRILNANPANASGKITLIATYTPDGMTNCEVATFYEISTGFYSTRDTQTIGTVNSGYQEHVVDLDVQIGDLIGFYFTAGHIDIDQSGEGCWQYVGDAIPADNVEFSSTANRTISVYGTGETTEGEAGTSIMFTFSDF